MSPDDPAVHPLITKLTERQRAAGESDRVFAQRFGLSQQGWQAMRTGNLRPGRRGLAAIMVAFPDLTPDVMSFFLAGDTRILMDAAIGEVDG